MEETAGWQPDVLGEGFEQLTLPLGSDDEGELVATLVRYRPPFRIRLRPGAAAGVDVLAVHGWSDYFFNHELAQFWADAGARFFALDLRKYGRSIRPGHTPGYVADLADYDADIDAALTAMASGDRPVILLGHSTGGLILSLWSARHPGRVSGLVLNSPWLEFQASGIGREALSPLIGLQARVDPRGTLPSVDLGYYARSVSREFEGSWVYDTSWRPFRGFPISPAWLAAVLDGHATVAGGIDVGAPALVLLSSRSLIQRRWSDDMHSSDVVLVVDDIARRATRLGSEVTVARIEGAIHDVFLSAPRPRAVAYDRVTRWLSGYRPKKRSAPHVPVSGS